MSVWKTVELGDLADFCSGGTPSKENPAYWGADVPWITVKDMKAMFSSSTNLSLTKAGASTLRIMPERTVYILVRGMGLFKDLPLLYCDRPATFNQDVKALLAKQSIDPLFLAYCLQAKKNQILRLVDTAGHGTGRLDTELLKSVPFLVPKKKADQSKIAVVLRTWDEAIEKANDLVAAKRTRYAGIRRMLIDASTAQGNSSARLSEITKRVRRINDGASHPVMTISSRGGFLLQSDKYSRDMAGSSLQAYTVLRRGEFAYNKGNSLSSPQGCIFRLAEESALVPHVYFCFALDRNQNPEFYGHVFESGYLNPQLSRVINSGVRNDGLLNLAAEDFFNCRVPSPSPDEQIRIAGVLNLLKSDIEPQEKRLELLRKQKRGLMQKLLTGEWQL